MSQINKKQGLGKGIRALLDTIDEEVNAPREGVPAVSGQNTNTIARIPLDHHSKSEAAPSRL